MPARKTYLLVLLISLALSACAPTPKGSGDARLDPSLADGVFVTGDGSRLPLRVWGEDLERPQALIVALHGFNDYSRAFSEVGHYWAEQHRIRTYAYDQRGFGDAPEPGSWAGTEAYTQDLRDICRALREAYPQTPLYVLGSSMGGAVSMVAFASERAPAADGLILAAPAVWARETMPWYQRMALFIGAHTIPWASFTGEGLGVTASDNRDMLIDLGRDPKVIKDTRVAAIYGLTNLMDAALAASVPVDRSLLLIGELDEVVPNYASAALLQRLQSEGQIPDTAIYEQGYHMLLRDLQRQVVWEDIAAWIREPDRTLPSAADAKNLEQWVKMNR